MAEWTKWDKRFMELAATIGTWSSCYQENRHIGAVIVRNKRIINRLQRCARWDKKLLRKGRMHEAPLRHTLRHAA